MTTDQTQKLDPTTCPHERMCQAYNPNSGGLTRMFCADCQREWSLAEIYGLLRSNPPATGPFKSPVVATQLIDLAERFCVALKIPNHLEFRPIVKDMVLDCALETLRLAGQVARDAGAQLAADRLTMVQEDVIVTMVRSVVSGG